MSWVCRHPASGIAVQFETQHLTTSQDEIKLEAVVWFYCLSCSKRFDILPHRRAVPDDKAYLPLQAEVK